MKPWPRDVDGTIAIRMLKTLTHNVTPKAKPESL